MSDDPPSSLTELFDLYYDRYKPLYNRIQAFNEMPVELLFELTAAWDHLSRHWKYDEPKQNCIDHAARHIKRAVFDAYKLILRETVEQYKELRRIDLSLIDNGEFDRELRQLISNIQQKATVARTSEGTTAADGWEAAFAKWDEVYAMMERFHGEFYLSAKVEWARRKTLAFTWKRRIEGFVIGIIAGVVVMFLAGCMH